MGRTASMDEAPPVPELVPAGDHGAYREAIRAFADVAAALLETRDRDELLRLVGQRLCELVGTPRCSVYLRDDASGLYHGQVGYADHDIDALVKRLTCGTDADGFTREIVETQAPVVIEHAATDPRLVQSTRREWHIVSMMGVPMVLRGEVIGIVFLDAEDEAKKFTPLHRVLASAFAELAAVAIAQGKLYAELRETADTVARQNKVLRRVSAVDDKLTGLVLDGQNLREIAEAVTDLTHKPCSIHDADGRRMACASPATLDAPTRPRLLDADMVSQPEIADALAALDPKKAAVIGPFPHAGLPHRFLVSPVTVRDDQWATLVIMEQGRGSRGFDMLMSRRTATVIALELSAERRAATAEWNARASLAGELIRGNSDVDQLEHRAQFVGMDLGQPHVLCLIATRAGADALRVPDARSVGDAFRAEAEHSGVVAAGVAEGVVVVLEVPADVPALKAVEVARGVVERVRAKLDPAGGLVAGLSTTCRGPGEYVRAYAQAQQVVRCLDTFHRAGSVDVLAADDLGAGRMFLANADAEEAERFVEETLGGLLDDDAVAGDLLLTLSAFFDHGRSIRWSAVELGVHENTVRYRLARVEELTGLAVANASDAQLSAQLALLVLRLQGRLPRRADAA